MSLVYGMYIIIYGLSINILWRRRESSASRAYARWITALFILTAIYNASTIWIYIDGALVAFNAVKTNDYISFYKSVSGQSSRSKLAAQMGLAGLSANIITCIFDYLMVHRCYIIWGYSKWILYPFAFVVLVSDTTGFVVSAIGTSAYQHHERALYTKTTIIESILVIIAAVYTSILTLLTAGRIWWMARQAAQLTGTNVRTKYKIFVATILESGLLYAITQVITVALTLSVDPDSMGLGPFDFNVISTHMAGIAQTLIILRIAYGQSVESVQQMISTLQFAEGVNNSQQRHTAARGTADLRQSLAGITEERGPAGRFEMGRDKPLSNVAENGA
ncbi:hypothetical protein PM082_004426 [Marasmius tenuissimus]|nr:hypothetical protein PM082_004426 [Marasmius tenuissimus]